MTGAATMKADALATEQAAVVESHISTLVMLGDRVYKIKKPLSFGFLDFSTREARRAACHAEVELNRRLAPDVYLGVADVVGPDGGLCEHMVVMRRMPADRRLATLVQGRADIDDELAAIARQVAAFHASADTSPAIAATARRDAVLARWERNFSELAPFAGTVLDAGRMEHVERLVRQYLAGREALFDHRIADGWARDGHGDLQAEDIFCLPDGPRILDCIEFDEQLRFGDVLADVAFLAMDLERLGAPAAGARFLRLYAEFSGENHPATLAEHYIAHRAHIRAKVACLRHAQGDPAAADAARSLLARAEHHLEMGRPMLLLVGGLPGTGKSTLAAGVADRLGWSILRSDEVRKDLAGLPHATHAAAEHGEGIYRPEMSAEVYRTLARRAGQLLSAGRCVVLDASWSDGRWRREAAEVARQTSSDLVELRCEAPIEIRTARLVRRWAKGTDPSDATPETAAAMASQADPWPTAAVIDTAGEKAAGLSQALVLLGRAG